MAQADLTPPLPPLLRWLLMLLPFALWGTAMAAMKPLLEGVDPLLVASLRLLPAALVLLLVARLLGRSLRVDPGTSPPCSPSRSWMPPSSRRCWPGASSRPALVWARC